MSKNVELQPGDLVWVRAEIEAGLGAGLIRLPEEFTSPEEPGVAFLQEVLSADVMPDAEHLALLSRLEAAEDYIVELQTLSKKLSGWDIVTDADAKSVKEAQRRWAASKT